MDRENGLYFFFETYIYLYNINEITKMLRLALEEIVHSGIEEGLSKQEIKSNITTFLKEDRAENKRETEANMPDKKMGGIRTRVFRKAIGSSVKQLAKAKMIRQKLEAKGKDTTKVDKNIKKLEDTIKGLNLNDGKVSFRATILVIIRVIRGLNRISSAIILLTLGGAVAMGASIISGSALLASVATFAGPFAAVGAAAFVGVVAAAIAFNELVFAVVLKVVEGSMKRAAAKSILRKGKAQALAKANAQKNKIQALKKKAA